MIGRREMLGLTTTWLSAATAAAAEDRVRTRPVRFVLLNDLHYQDDGCRPWFERVSRSIRDLTLGPEPPEFVLAAGDLVEKGTAAEFAGSLAFLESLKLPYYTVIGNHDYSAGDRRDLYDRTFPNRLNYQFEHAGLRFLGLDTSDGLRYQDTAIRQTTIDWVRADLKTVDPTQPLITFTHFPLGEGVRYRPTNADALLQSFQGYRLEAVLSGHFHGDTQRQHAGTHLATHRCCAWSRANHDGTKEKGYSLYHWTGDRLGRRPIWLS